MNKSELKPCPFCGYPAVFEPSKERKGYAATIRCCNCPAEITTITYDTENEAEMKAIEDWNRRASEDAPTADVVERKKGRWKMEWDSFFHRDVPVCSQCLQAAAYKFDVCPYCGADMREDAVQKKGKWIWHDAKDGYLISAYSCSVCNFFSSTSRPNICPGCGADMREKEKTDE